MPEETDPQRELYRFKPREFVRLNDPPGNHTDPGDPPESPPGAGPDSRSARETAAACVAKPADAHSAPKPAEESPRSVGQMLRDNARKDAARGWYQVRSGPDRLRRRRIITYWATLAAVDTPLALVAWYSGHTDPVPFVFALAGLAYFTGRYTWETWFLRTD